MKRDLSYPFEKFMVAVDALATSPERLQDRLHSAFMTFHTIRVEDFDDPDMQSALNEIMDRLTKVRDAEKGYVPATVEQMSDEDAKDVAELIFGLFMDIARVELASRRG